MIVDHSNNALIFDDGLIVPFSELFLGEENDDSSPNYEQNYTFTYDFIVKNAFPDSLGKYSQLFGNVAFIDCHYVFTTFIDSVSNELDPRWFIQHPERYFEIKESLARLKNYVEKTNTTACDFAYEIDAVLKD